MNVLLKGSLGNQKVFFDMAVLQKWVNPTISEITILFVLLNS